MINTYERFIMRPTEMCPQCGHNWEGVILALLNSAFSDTFLMGFLEVAFIEAVAAGHFPWFQGTVLYPADIGSPADAQVIYNLEAGHLRIVGMGKLGWQWIYTSH